MTIDEALMARGLARTMIADEPSTEADPIALLIREGAHREAIAQCARAHGVALGRLCMAFTGSQAESEELVQETLIAALAALPSYRGEGTVRAFLFTIARRLAARHMEIGRRREARLRLVHDVEQGADAAEFASDCEQADRARAALARLKPSERDAVVLRFQGELSFREVAEACGVDEAAARKRVSRALGRLREDLGEER